MVRLGIDVRGRRVKEMSHLEHELAEASSSLKQSLGANSTYEGKMIRAAADLEITETRAA